MPHHREGIQNELDKAYDEGHRDNEAINATKAEVVKEESGHMDDKEMRGELSLEETVSLLKDKGYLDTSFEGKEVHPLAMRALSREEAFAEYEKSGGRAWIAKDDFKSKSYTIPNLNNIDVVILKFNDIEPYVGLATDQVLERMGSLGVRPLTFEETIQYGIAYPAHQEQYGLVSLDLFRSDSDISRKFSVLSARGGQRDLSASVSAWDWTNDAHFLTARK